MIAQNKHSYRSTGPSCRRCHAVRMPGAGCIRSPWSGCVWEGVRQALASLRAVRVGMRGNRRSAESRPGSLISSSCLETSGGLSGPPPHERAAGHMEGSCRSHICENMNLCIVYARMYL